MKKVFAIFTVIFLMLGICSGQTECYNVPYSTYGVIYGNEVSQSFVNCFNGNQVIVSTWIARWPIPASGDKIEVSDQFGNVIGTHIIEQQIPIAQTSQGAYSTQPTNFTFIIDCTENLQVGSVYEISFVVQGPSYYDAQWMGLWPINLFFANGGDQLQGQSTTYLPEIGDVQIESINSTDEDICMEIQVYSNHCRGDCNGDGILTVADLLCLINEIGQTCETMDIQMDMDGDCDVDGDDVQLFKIHYSQPCTWQ